MFAPFRPAALVLLLVALLPSVRAEREVFVTVTASPITTSPESRPPALVIAGQATSLAAVGAVPGWPAGQQPLAGASQDGAAFVVALDSSGRPRLWRHRDAGGWTERSTPPAALLPGAIRPSGQAHLLALAAPEAGTLRVLSYHTITNAWAVLGTVPAAGGSASAIVTASGFALEVVGPDGATARQAIGISSTKRLLQTIDWVVIVLYLSASAGIGLYFYLREKKKSNEDFFLGGRSIPWWAAGISLYATGTSAISFIAIPAKSFATNWQLLSQNVVGLVATAFVAILIVPLIRQLNVMSVYQYLEMRFHPSIRTLASAINIVIQLGGRMSIVLFLPALALSAVTGIDVTWSILLMGVVTIVYTLLGGMRAVIWTDVLQVFVMLGGAFFAIGYVVWKVEGGIPEFMRAANADGKMHLFEWSLDLKQPTIVGFLFFAVVDIITYPKDQVMMQRVLATKDAKEAGWSVWTLAALVVPGSFTFFAIGTALYVFYQQNPERMNPALSVDATFPHFIAAELPVGVTGLIIAGIFAASMSTLSSCMNSVATLVSVDFYERFAKKPTQEKSVRLAEWMTVIAGLIGVGTALLLAKVDIKSALDKSWELWSLLGGGFAGCYGLGMFSRRANWQGAIIGVIASIILTFTAWRLGLVNSVFYQTLSVASCLVVGYAASFLFPAPRQSLLGLTVFDRRPNP
jgi:solute:Na+ symporter, SSS family